MRELREKFHVEFGATLTRALLDGPDGLHNNISRELTANLLSSLLYSYSNSLTFNLEESARNYLKQNVHDDDRRDENA
jgi:hypothetical protein